MSNPRPNFLIFMVDQQRADCIGTFGSTAAHTPNIDALAHRGVRFDNAWCQHPVCGPSRVSLMTGWYPHVAGHRTLDNLLTHDEPNLLRILKDGGYQVAMPGHRGDVFAPGVTEASTDFCGFVNKPDHGGFGKMAATYPADHPMSMAFYLGNQGANAPADHDEATIESAIEFVEQHRDERPFAMWVNLLYPHVPFQVEEPWFSLHDRESMPLPLPRDAGSGKAGYYAELRRRYGWDAITDDQWREIVATYHGMISRTDDQLGRVIAAIEARGELDNTVCIYLSDHGEYLGDYGLVEKWPSAMDPSIVANPLVIAGPGVHHGTPSDSLVEIIDLVPTVLEMADIEPGYTHFGRSLVDVLDDPTQPHREVVFTEGGFNPIDADLFERAGWLYQHKSEIQHDLPDLVAKAHAVRTATHTYVYRQCESDELYDRVVDPHETTNLIDDPAYADVRADLERRLLEHMIATSDVIPWEKDPRSPKIPHGVRSNSD